MTTANPTYQELLTEVISVKQENAQLKEQLEWFKRQLFGKKSERVIPIVLNNSFFFLS